MQNPFIGHLEPAGNPPETGFHAIHKAIFDISKPVFIFDKNGSLGVSQEGRAYFKRTTVNDASHYGLFAYAPPLQPKDLGHPAFKHRYNIKYPYIAGAMAHGISSVELVKSAGSAGMIGFFGSAGLSMTALENAIVRLKSEAAAIPYGFNLVFTGSSEQEMAIVELYLKHGIRLISAAGYLRLTLPLLYYRLKGIYQSPDGTITCPNQIIAKTSRLEIATQFLSPPADKLLKQLVEQNLLSREEASLAKSIPVAQDLTAEADSGGHTDNRAAISLLPSMLDLRDDLSEKFQYDTMPCIGLGGGIATPKAVAAAFTMGADYVLAGSVNQSCTESGTSITVKQMLASALQTDVIMAPSANMFERGIKVQVLKRGTFFAQRAARLYEIYRDFESIEQIPEKVKNEIEDKILQNTLENEWELTRQFFKNVDPFQLSQAENDPKRRMSLIFRSYLGKSSKWAINGEPSRIKDYQIWCGPSMGAFNEWTKGSFLEFPDNRQFKTVAMNLLFGACIALRRQSIVQGGIFLPPHIGKYKPMPLSDLNSILNPAGE